MEPMTSPPGPSASVMSVWHVAHSSDCWTCDASFGFMLVTERMTDARPASTAKGPNISRAVADGGRSTKRPTKLAGVPSRSLVI
jgi:hypothetical protein